MFVAQQQRVKGTLSVDQLKNKGVGRAGNMVKQNQQASNEDAAQQVLDVITQVVKA